MNRVLSSMVVNHYQFTTTTASLLLQSPVPSYRFMSTIPVSYSAVAELHRSQTVRRNASTNPHSIIHLPPTSAYVHLPFCRKRCHYCDFPIIALGSSVSNHSNDDDDDDPRISNYVHTICREINATQLPHAPAFSPLQTVFFGGGTPSLVPPHLVSSILHALSDRFGLCSDAEISIEMDPGTFDAGKLRALLSLGVNRVSLGVQAFQEELLKACGRAHGVEDIYEALEIVRSCGVENWSLDLISSLPHQSPSMWEESLQLSIRAQPTHISVYDLQVEQNTKFGVLYTPGEFPLPSENQSAEFYRMASRTLRSAGYCHYEISSYCKSGYRCKHNSTYWKNKPFYAFGLGSASYLGGVRFSRPRKLKEYVDYVENLKLHEHVNPTKNGDIDTKDLAMDTVMLSLRTADGLDLKVLGEDFGESLVLAICKAYMPYVESGHVLCLDEQRRVVAADEAVYCLANEPLRSKKLAFLRLSDPDGFLLSNELISVAFQAIAP